MKFELFMLLLMGHFVADYALQSIEMGKGKNRNRPVDLTNVPPGQKLALVWPLWMTAHTAVHAMVVFLLTGSIFIACLEWLAHWIIDFCKCENWLTVYQDQALHIWCKAAWVSILLA